MKTYMKEKGDVLKTDRDNPISEELDAQRNNNDWFPTQHEIVDLCTIGKINNKKMMQAFGGGFQASFKNSSKKARNCTNLMLLILYCGSFFGYAYSDLVWDDSKLGLATAITIACCDAYLWLLFKASFVKRLSGLTSIAAASRILVFGGGKSFWIYGYMIYYMLFSVVLMGYIVRKRFPYATAITQDSILDDSRLRMTFHDVAALPEFILLVSTVGLILTVSFVAAAEPEGVLPQAIHINNSDLPFTAVCGLCILIVLTIFTCMAVLRSYTRRKQGLKTRVHYYLFHRAVDLYYICCLGLIVLTYIWCLIFFALYGQEDYLIPTMGAFIPWIFLA
jgi:hypothetical protein